MKARRGLAIIGSILLLCLLGAGIFGFYSFRASTRSDTEIDSTASVMNYFYRHLEGKKTKLLKNCSFSFWEEVEIPGMPSSKLEDVETRKIFSSSQCPQGICLTDKFLLLTSYSEEDEELGELFVFDRDTGSYLVTLGMNPESHLGGVTFDGENIWVCNSSSNTIERISYDFVVLMAEQNQGEVVDASTMVDTFSVENTPSCITYYDDRLWIATHTIRGKAALVAYHYNQLQNELISLNQYQIPSKVQGIAFDDLGRVYVSTSYGRASSSYLKVYSSLFAMSGDPNNPQLNLEMPPESEEIAIWNRKMYILFESAAEKYYNGTDGKGISISPIDKILLLDMEEVSDSY